MRVGINNYYFEESRMHVFVQLFNPENGFVYKQHISNVLRKPE